jgi:hypothetical protein
MTHTGEKSLDMAMEIMTLFVTGFLKRGYRFYKMVNDMPVIPASNEDAVQLNADGTVSLVVGFDDFEIDDEILHDEIGEIYAEEPAAAGWDFIERDPPGL